MGNRGEVFSTRLNKGDRTYFFNVKENIYGDLFLNMVESRPTEIEGRFIRQSIVVYPEDLGEFLTCLQKSVDYLKGHSKNEGEFPERKGRIKVLKGENSQNDDEWFL